jgi:hypothetical protein
MTSSRSSSSRAALLLTLLASGAAGCAAHHSTVASRPVARVAVLPVENLSGASVQGRPTQEAMELAVARAGAEVIGGEQVERFLAQHWIRYTGGVDAETARAAREELGVDALLLTSIGFESSGAPPRIALGVRLVSAEDRPRILWADGVYRWGDEAPGLLNLGLVNDPEKLRRRALQQLAGSLRDFLSSGGHPASACAPGGRFRPQIGFAARRAAASRTLSVMVLPFLSQADRPVAAAAVAAEVVRALHATGRFEVVEPGLVRDELLRNRVIFQGGVSLDIIQPVLADLPADLILTGTVFDYQDGETAASVKVGFSLVLLDRETGRVVWAGTSSNGGVDDEFLFGRGQIRIAAALACRMARTAAEEMVAATGSARR